MTEKNKGRREGFLMTFLTVIITGAISWWILKADAKDKKLEAGDQLKITTEVIQAIKPEIDSKLPIKTFETYKVDHERQTQENKESFEKIVEDIKKNQEDMYKKFSNDQKTNFENFFKMWESQSKRIDDLINLSKTTK